MGMDHTAIFLDPILDGYGCDPQVRVLCIAMHLFTIARPDCISWDRSEIRKKNTKWTNHRAVPADFLPFLESVQLITADRTNSLD